MSNVWLSIHRATLSACVRQPLRSTTSIRTFSTHPWKQRLSQNPSNSYLVNVAAHDRAVTALRFQLLSRRWFTNGATRCNRDVRRRRPVTHARQWAASETQEGKEADSQAAESLEKFERPGLSDGPGEAESAVPDPRHYSLPDQPYDQAQIDQIFGHDSGVDSRQGNYILAVLHQRRLTGSIAEEGISEPAQAGYWSRPAASEALQWLRLKHPVDEEATTAQWAEEEARRIESELYTQRGVSLGLFKPAEGGQPAQPAVSPYAGGVLDGMSKAIKRQRTVNEKKREEAEAREEQERLQVQDRLLRDRKLEQQERNVAAKVSVPSAGRKTRVGQAGGSREVQQSHISHEGLEEWGGYKTESQWSRRYRKQAAEAAMQTPPKMTKLQRLLPSTIVAAFTLAGCFLLSTYYEPVDAAYRLFPFISPAFATCGALIAANLAVAAAWRYPPFWRALNKYFIMAPGYPFAASVVANVFSHMSFWHLWPSLIFIGTGGVLVHEMMGSRGDFLALYMGAGVFASWLSLAVRVSMGTLYTSTLGASGAIAGVIAAGCILAPDHTWTIKIPATDRSFEIWTMLVLPFFVLAELVRMGAKGSSMDHLSHLGGYAAGTVGSLLLQRRYTDRAKDAELRRQAGGFGGNAVWRQNTQPNNNS